MPLIFDKVLSKKRALITALLSFISAVSFGQVRAGLIVGGQLSHFRIVSDGVVSNEDVHGGLMAGGLLDIPVSKKFSIRPHFLFSAKGSNHYIVSSIGTSLTFSFNLNYLELPVQLIYKSKLGPGQWVAGAGPYIGYAIGAKRTYKLLNQSYKDDIEFGSDKGQYKRIDVGLRLSAGYESRSGVLLSAYYSPGFSNIIIDPSDVVSNRTLGLSIGYLLGKK